MAKVILDISHYEAVKDWKKLKENVSFLIFKGTQGTTYLDPTCYKNIEMCEKNGIPYWIYCFLNKGNELAQAKYLVDKVKSEVGKYFVGYCIDVEAGNSVTGVQSALDYVKKYSKKTMIYTAHHYYDTYKDLVAKRGDNCAWWEPRYGGNKPHAGVDLWQYSENYTCSFISGKTDINRINGKKTLSWFTSPLVATKSTSTSSVPKGAEKVIKIAEGEVGYLEKKTNKSLDSKTANAGSKNYTKYGKWIGANGDYWCASFLSWIFYKAYGTTLGKQLLCGVYSAACETIRKNFVKKNQYKSSPKIGDVIFFSGTRHSGANHIGIVYKVADSKVYTIEGNTSGASGVIDNGGGVAKKSYASNYSRIMGYGRPDYSLTQKTTTTVTTPKTTTYYAKCKSTYSSLVDALASVGVKDTSKAFRTKIAKANGIASYSGTASQNDKLLKLLKAGKLIKA